MEPTQTHEHEINADAFFMVQYWMRKELKLKGAELQVYAIIHGFSQDGISFCYSTLNYFEEMTGLSRNTILDALKNLIEKKYIQKKAVTQYLTKNGLIKKGKGSQHYNIYWTTRSRSNETPLSSNVDIQETDRNVAVMTDDRANSTSSVSAPVTSSVSAPVTSSVSAPNNNIYINLKNSSSQQKENTDQEEEIKKYLAKKFNGHYPFDNGFIHKVYMYLSDNDLVGCCQEYIDFTLKKCLEKKPESLPNFFYKMFFSETGIYDFTTEKSKKTPVKVKPKICPICGQEARRSETKCSICDFDLNYSTDEEVIRIERQVFNLPYNRQQQYRREIRNYDAQALRIGFLGNPEKQKKLNEQLKDIYMRYGIKA